MNHSAVLDEEIQRISEQTISLIPSLGVSNETLLTACKNLGLEDSYDKFPQGIYDVLEYMNQQLLQNVTSIFRNHDPEDLPRIRDKIRYILKLCLLYYASFPDCRKLVRAILQFSCLPHNVYFATCNIFKVADTTWYIIGDSSTNFSYYTKRWTVSLVYTSSLLHFVNDYSEGFVETLSFMDRRIENVLRFQKIKHSIKSMLPKMPGIFDVRFDR